MSGMEIVGVLLGAFPLCISAMEHYEDMRKVAGTFFKIRRAHKKDLGKVKDCQLMFKLNLKELLIPLLRDDIVDQIEYEQLLAMPGGPNWAVDHVETALVERLSDCHERYVEILQEMQETMAGLYEACRVDDEQFQRHLRQKEKTAVAASATKQAQDQLLLKANSYLCFQAKRVKYAFTPTRREELLEELEDQNNKLQTVLQASDRVSALSKQRTRTHIPSVNAKTLKFWRHADNIYRLLRDTWHCTCRSCASLWLQQHPKKLVQMNFVLQFCHGRRALNIQLSDTPPVLQLPSTKPSKQLLTSTRNPASSASVSIHSQTSRVSVNTGSRTTTIMCTSQSASISSTAATCPSPTLSLQSHGLCKSFSAITNTHDCLGRLTEGNDEYAVFPDVETVSCAHGTSLADILRPDATCKLTRVQRHGIALTLASSHLQLHSTPWLKEYWTSSDVLFPTTNNNNTVTIHGEPYILAPITPSPNSSTPPVKDRSFSTLGIVLLELCFGKRLEDHKMWRNPAYAALKGDPILRQTVACEWLEDVPGEAGEVYAMATEWTLKQSPAVLKDEKWREEFARNVVQPLQRYYEYFHGEKNT